MKVVEREYRYYKGKPVLTLRRAFRDNGSRYFIEEQNLHKHSDQHNDDFDEFLVGCVARICKRLDLDIPKGDAARAQFQASIASTIIDGIDDVVKMPPYREGIDDPSLVIDKRLVTDEMPDIRVGLMQS
ncbi:MAG: hypothetical protein ACOYOS_00075 [Syntrophales bacterium]